MKIRPLRNVSTLLLLFLSCTFVISAQQPLLDNQGSKSLNYGFISPNVREGMKLDEALSEMNSRTEWDFIQRVRRFRCIAKTEIRVYRAIGSWSDGAENSSLLKIRTDEPTIRYLVSRMGRDADQKAVLYFHSQTNGSAKLYILRATNRIRSFHNIIRLLDRAGILFRTLVPTRTTTLVYLVDTDNKLSSKVSTAAKLLRARVSTRMGNAAFIGDNSQREKARAIFAQEIKDFETTHPASVAACRGRLCLSF